MLQDHPVFSRAWKQGAGFVEPLLGLQREAGLAAIAVELNLQLYELAPEVAEAVERGAAALFLGGYGPSPTLTSQIGGVGAEKRQRKATRGRHRARRSSNLQKGERAAR